MTFLRVMLGRGWLGRLRHRIGEAWENIWANKPLLTTRAMSLMVRLQRLHANVLPLLTLGSPLLASAEGLARSTVHDFRLAIEGWFDWHLRTWRNARKHLTAAWGCRPIVIIAACLMSAVR